MYVNGKAVSQVFGFYILIVGFAGGFLGWWGFFLVVVLVFLLFNSWK